jgi:hypothetical protein
MKCTLTNFLLFILLINHMHVIFISCSKSQSAQSESYLSPNPLSQQNVIPDKQKLIQCKLCEEMFDFNFNYEEILKSKKIDSIRRAFGALQSSKDDFSISNYFSKDNMEFVTKEISMQYFFKGADSLIDEVDSLKFKECKNNKTSNTAICQKLKLGVCEKVLNYEDGVCVNLQNHLKSIIAQMNNLRGRGKKDKEITSDTPEQLSNSIPEISIETLRNKKLQELNRMNNISNLNKVQPLHLKPIEEGIINFQKFHFKQRNGVKENTYTDLNDKDGDVIKQFGDISLLQLSPEYIKQNFDSVPKSHWQPPKPVLLQNFERNIGDELKDISSLARLVIYI